MVNSPGNTLSSHLHLLPHRLRSEERYPTVHALADDIDVAVPVVDGRFQPLAAAYRSDVVTLADERVHSMHALLDRCRRRPLDVDDPTVLRKLNTPADYAAADL